MGIRKLRRAREPHDSPVPHYPSWGSETIDIGVSPAVRLHISLPLMGIRNTSSRATRSWCCTTHYPSWGSETLADWRFERAHRKLTTPHGDQKPCSSPCCCSVGSAEYSLPLMGIRNTSTAAPSWRIHRAHYPSWGSETRQMSTRFEGMTSSLPLMGIRNVLAAE